MAAYDHRFSVLVIDGHAINDWADGTDVLQINPSSDIGTLTEFLSCLSGSERVVHLARIVPRFLSCLSGSEHRYLCFIEMKQFLSCLSGSEL